MKKLFEALTPEQFAAIGRIAVESAYLEEFVEIMIAWLTNLSLDELGILLPGTMLGSKLDTLRDLGLRKLKSATKKAKFGGIMSQISHFNSQRTVAVHGQWRSQTMIKLSDVGKNIPLRPDGNAVAVHKRGKKQSAPMHAGQLESLADSILENREILVAFCFRNWIDPSIRRAAARARAKDAP